MADVSVPTGTSVVLPDGLFIGGKWTPPSTGDTREIHSPHDGRRVASVAEAGPADVEAAVAAARLAFDEGEWPHLSALERGRVLHQVGDAIDRNIEDLAALETLDTGKPIGDSREDMVDAAILFRYYAGITVEEAGRTIRPPSTDVTVETVREPVGVVAVIAPWNYPLMRTAFTVAPALAVGCSVVVKPSELTPLSTTRLAEIIATETEVPDGVFNLVLGDGSVGTGLSSHPGGVDMVSFCGRTATGRRVMEDAAGTIKNICLALGGNNAHIVFGDVDPALVADHALAAAFMHSGQVCSRGSRLLVHEDIHDELLALMEERIRRIRPGDGFDERSHTGPLISEEHRETVERFVQRAVDEGAEVRYGGRRPEDPELADGWYYEPTLITGCRPDSEVATEEVFGPVLTVESFRGEDEVVGLVNASPYGLAAGVWTNDGGRAKRVSRRLRVGVVWINDYDTYVPQADWGGFKQSGFGRELGHSALLEYTENKTIYHTVNPAPASWLNLPGEPDRRGPRTESHVAMEKWEN